MAEFQEVMKQWRRMCDKHLCSEKHCYAVTYDLICPITISHEGNPCSIGFVDCSPESMAQVEQIVMEWASENPEPVYEYPTWWEYLQSIGVLGVNASKTMGISYATDRICTERVPKDIAEALGIEPKEVK